MKKRRGSAKKTRTAKVRSRIRSALRVSRQRGTATRSRTNRVFPKAKSNPPAPVTLKECYRSGVRDGSIWLVGYPGAMPTSDQAKRVFAESWRRYVHSSDSRQAKSWNAIFPMGCAYRDGFLQAVGVKTQLTPLPLRGTAAAVVYAHGDAARYRKVMEQLAQLPLQEIVAVMNEKEKELRDVAESYENTVIVNISDPPRYGNAAANALGAKYTSADTVLFLDGQRLWTAEKLGHYLWLCGGRQADAALSDTVAANGEDKVQNFRRMSERERLRLFLNVSLRRPDLRTNSLEVLPYALSRQALNALGSSALAVPPTAQAILIRSGLRISRCEPISMPRFAEKTGDSDSPEWNIVAGDYLEAWRYAMDKGGGRLQFTDRGRNRSFWTEGRQHPNATKEELS
jgi:hypothetical protein